MKTRLLLDTCAVFYVTERKLGGEALSVLDRAFEEDAPVSVSAITAWEIGLLSAKGKLPTTAPPLRYFEEFVALPGIRMEALTPSTLVESSFLPEPLHRDPADRIIIATARSLGMTIMTSDRLILDYAARGHVLALPC
jgi:PIN domain nuclease of toxin-antitoxin system